MTPMTLERLRTLLDAYGADPQRWPAAERAAAQALLAASAAARAAVEDAAALDRYLTVLPNPAEGAISPLQLVAAVTAQPQAGTPKRAAVRFVIRWPNVAGLAAAALAGFIVGWTGLDLDLSGAEGAVMDTEQSALFGDSTEDWTW